MLQVPPQPLYAWQATALEAWARKGRNGIIAAATGTGKTLLALHAMRACGADRVAVVVPSRALQDQWVRILRTQAKLPGRKLGQIGGSLDDFKLHHRVVVAVINSARLALASPVNYWRARGDRVLLVVDECHWAGSPTSSRLFEAPTDYTLGLSATPERTDGGLEELLIPHLGPIVFRYTLRQAMDDGVVSEIVAKHRFFDLMPADQRRVDMLLNRLTEVRQQAQLPECRRPVSDSMNSFSASASTRVSGITGRMLRCLRLAHGRVETAVTTIQSEELRHRTTIVFNETIRQAEQIGDALRAAGYRFAVEHSKLPSATRQAALDRFAAGAVSALVTVRALDEGIDIPDADTALIVSGSLQVRQRAQRIGRIARVCDTDAEVISILARYTPEHWEVPLVDARLLGPHRVPPESLDLP